MFSFQKINQTSSSSINDEEKAKSIGSVFTSDFIYSTERSSYIGHQYIAISPDGIQIVTLDTETCQLNLRRSDNLTEFQTINYDDFKRVDSRVNWSLAVSNEFTLADGAADLLIAVSCFDDDYMEYKNFSSEEAVGGGNMHEDAKGKSITWIISAARRSRIPLQ
jgi:hypothetical protein